MIKRFLYDFDKFTISVLSHLCLQRFGVKIMEVPLPCQRKHRTHVGSASSSAQPLLTELHSLANFVEDPADLLRPTSGTRRSSPIHPARSNRWSPHSLADSLPAHAQSYANCTLTEQCTSSSRIEIFPCCYQARAEVAKCMPDVCDH